MFLPLGFPAATAEEVQVYDREGSQREGTGQTGADTGFFSRGGEFNKKNFSANFCPFFRTTILNLLFVHFRHILCPKYLAYAYMYIINMQVLEVAFLVRRGLVWFCKIFHFEFGGFTTVQFMCTV